MAIKVEVRKKIKENKYPCLKHYPKTGEIVLFRGEETGILLNDSSNACAGFYSSAWLEENFEPFQGEITLSND